MQYCRNWPTGPLPNKPIKDTKRTITPIKVASTSLDKKVIIWKVDLLLVKNNQHVNEIKIKYQQILNYKHEQTLWRLSWNNNGMMLSVKGEDRKPLIFWNVKGRYTKMDLIGE